MAFRDLIPWTSRTRNAPSRFGGGESFASPMMALHREIDRAFDQFWNEFGRPIANRDGFGVAHVALGRADALRRRRRQRLQGLARAGHRQHLRALIRERRGRGPAEAAAGAGDDRDLALQCEIDHGTTSVSFCAIPRRSTSEAPS